MLLTLFFTVTTFGFYGLEQSARKRTYEAYLQKAENAGTKEAEIEAYHSAINLEPSREEGYLQLLQECFLHDGVLQREESEELRHILYDYGNGAETNLEVFSKNKKATLSDGFSLAPQVGLEPTTLRLTAACSTD